METRSVSRCVAIAAHGKRCQQSPFRGSPYCWHHTQSRKIWAPSRPMATGSTVAGRAASPADETVADGLATPPEGGREGHPARPGRTRLAELLGPRGVEDLLDFLEGGDRRLVRDHALHRGRAHLRAQPPATRPARRRSAVTAPRRGGRAGPRGGGGRACSGGPAGRRRAAGPAGAARARARAARGSRGSPRRARGDCGRAAPVGQRAHDDGQGRSARGDLDPVAHPHVPRGLHAGALHVDAAAGDGLGGQRARLEEPRRPQPLVDAHLARRSRRG